MERSSSTLSDTLEDDFDILCKKVTSLTRVNEEILESIEARMYCHVISEYRYNINVKNVNDNIDVVANADQDESQSFPVSASPRVNKVFDLICSWQYTGDPLKEELIFGSYGYGFTPDLSLSKYEDVKRLTTYISIMADKYTRFFCNKAEIRSGLRTILSNLELLQVALGQLQELTIDAKKEMKEIQQISNKLFGLCGDQTKISFSSLHLEGLYIKGSRPNFFTPNFGDFSSFHCAYVKIFNTRPVHALESCFYNGKQCLVSGTSHGRIQIHSMQNYSLEKTLVEYLSEGVYNTLCVYSHNDMQCLASGCGSKIKLWNLMESYVIADLDGHKTNMYALKVSYLRNKENMVLISSGHDNTIKLWDLDTYDLITSIESVFGNIYDIIVFNAKSLTYIVGAGNQGKIGIWNSNDNVLLTKLSSHDGLIWKLETVEHNGKVILASGGSDTYIRLWDMTSFSCIHVLKGHSGAIRALSFVPSNDKLYLVSGSQEIKIWNVEERSEVKTVTGFQGIVRSFLQYKDGNESYLVSGHTDGYIRIWKQ